MVVSKQHRFGRTVGGHEILCVSELATGISVKGRATRILAVAHPDVPASVVAI